MIREIRKGFPNRFELLVWRSERDFRSAAKPSVLPTKVQGEEAVAVNQKAQHLVFGGSLDCVDPGAGGYCGGMIGSDLETKTHQLYNPGVFDAIIGKVSFTPHGYETAVYQAK